jgi:hypothetical protein
VKAATAIKKYFSVPFRRNGTPGNVTMAELKELRGIGIRDPDVKAKCQADYDYLAQGACEELGEVLT